MRYVIIITVVVAALLGGAATAATTAPLCMSDSKSLTVLDRANDDHLDATELSDIDEWGLALRAVNRGNARITRNALPCNTYLRRARNHMLTSGKHIRLAILSFKAGYTSRGNRYLRLATFYGRKSLEAFQDYRDTL
jgi:hypothetical protein